MTAELVTVSEVIVLIHFTMGTLVSLYLLDIIVDGWWPGLF